MSNPAIKAKLVYDQHRFEIPSDLMPAGKTAVEACSLIVDKGQMQGTDAEKVVELAGRSCYDSLGAGRNSVDYHKHIFDVGHLSVCEHYNFTVGFEAQSDEARFRLLKTFANRPGIWLVPTKNEIQATMNLRSFLEWFGFNTDFFEAGIARGDLSNVGDAIGCLVDSIAPMIASNRRREALTVDTLKQLWKCRLVPNHELTSDQQRWVSLFMAGSRGWSHEQVRHGDRTAISQRSTRYVDETDSGWIEHPVITAYKKEGNVPLFVLTIPDSSKATCLGEYIGQDIYAPTVDKLQAWLISKGVDKFTARKQARGAARGYLGNALGTEMIFSASVAQWHTILHQRLNAAADAEIREVSYKALAELKRSAWGHAFQGFETKPSPDGIGYVLA